MTSQQIQSADPRVQAAIADLRRLIAERFPNATFSVSQGDDPTGTYLTATVDVDDIDEVIDAVIERLIALQVDEELPVYVVPVRTPARVRTLLESRRLDRVPAALPR